MPVIQRVPLNFENLSGLLDGKIDAMLCVHLKRAAVDCLDRPGETKPRKVTLTFEFIPIQEAEGYADRAACAVAAKSSLPNHVSTPMQLELNPQGFLFNRDAPDQLDQTSMAAVPGFLPEAGETAKLPAPPYTPDDDDVDDDGGEYDDIDDDIDDDDDDGM